MPAFLRLSQHAVHHIRLDFRREERPQQVGRTECIPLGEGRIAYRRTQVGYDIRLEVHVVHRCIESRHDAVRRLNRQEPENILPLAFSRLADFAEVPPGDFGHIGMRAIGTRI